MNSSSIEVNIISQLKDNYAYIIYDNETKEAIVIDPAESESILQILKKQNFTLKSILLTHHHNDHTGGVQNLLKYFDVPVYSPSKSIKGTTNLVKNLDHINLKFISIEVMATPGHTLDHVIYYDKKNKLLFSGDTLFRLGCGRIFEGTYEAMYNCLKKIENLDDNFMVYCGHEYTINNLRFLKSLFPENEDLKTEEEKILLQLKKTNFSIPFNLGNEKRVNPFLSTKSIFYENFKKNNNFNEFQIFSFLRKQKDNF